VDGDPVAGPSSALLLGAQEQVVNLVRQTMAGQIVGEQLLERAFAVLFKGGVEGSEHAKVLHQGCLAGARIAYNGN
jgi:hypothetical protein